MSFSLHLGTSTLGRGLRIRLEEESAGFHPDGFTVCDQLCGITCRAGLVILRMSEPKYKIHPCWMEVQER